MKQALSIGLTGQFGSLDFFLTIFLTVGLLATTLLLMVPSATNLYWQLHAWRTPLVHGAVTGHPPTSEPFATFSAIVPFRHERESMVRATVQRLLDQTHQYVQVILSVGHDDPDAVQIAESLAALDERIAVSVDHSPAKNKPRQLNTALQICVGDYVAIIDAESLAHHELFAHADAMIRATRCQVLQAGVQLINHRTTWFSLRNCLEYYFWFRSRLHLHARHGFIPLGGNTVFIHRQLLVQIGGWDGAALTEDCELGVRLSALGVSVAVAYDPRLVTREETPDTVRALVKQRSRWNQGFLQVLAKGVWRDLPTRRERMLARFTLLQPYLQALTILTLPLSISAALLLEPPLLVALITFLPLIPTIGMLLFECAALREFGRDLNLAIGFADYVRLVFSTLPYYCVLGYAALRAMVRHRRGNQEWEKTHHSGHHLVSADTSYRAAT